MICKTSVPQIFAASCQDKALLATLAKSCPGCDQMLSFSKGRQGEEMMRSGYSWGVVEGANLFRRGKYVYTDAERERLGLGLLPCLLGL